MFYCITQKRRIIIIIISQHVKINNWIELKYRI
jgi:hypothetical protein